MSQRESKPCELLPTEQRAALDLPPLDHAGILTCDFQQRDPHVWFSLQLFLKTDILERAYAESNQERWQRFEAITIAGQPAVIHSFAPPGPYQSCEVVVGTRPGQGFTINASGSDKTADWCGKGSRAAEYVVRNLGG